MVYHKSSINSIFLINRYLNGFFGVIFGLSADYPKFIRSSSEVSEVTPKFYQSNSKETPKFQRNSKVFKLKSEVFRGFPRFLWH